MPKVSRTIRACTECQKQKVKCNTQEGSSVCVRCMRTGLECVLYRNLQTILDEDKQWKVDFQKSIDRLQSITEVILTKVNLPDMSKYDENGKLMPESALAFPDFADQIQQTPSIPVQLSYCSPTGSAISRQQQAINNRFSSIQAPTHSPSYYRQIQEVEDAPNAGGDDIQGESEELTTEPMGSLYEVTRLNKFRRRPTQGESLSPRDNIIVGDFISRGVISVGEAEDLLKMFTQTLNHYLWVGLDERHISVDMIRRSSPLLTASIMTAMSLHIPNRTDTFEKCYAEFLSLVSQSMFSHTHNLDDIKGLTIAAFWLSDLSWKLSGHAVRIATELELHRSFSKSSESVEHHERARIWYMLYVCDHHFATAYGRPPMVHESQQIVEHESFLNSPFSSPLDIRLLSQVSIFMILQRIYEDFDERSSTFTAEMAKKMHNYNMELDRWRHLWEPRQVYNEYIGNFPARGNVLYYNFAKLQLNGLCLSRHTRAPSAPADFTTREFSNLATTAARNIIDLLLEDPSLRRALVGTPIYVHTMLTFACVFLFKVGTKWRDVVSGGVMLDVESLCVLIEQVVDCLNRSRAGERHLIYRIANGLQEMISGYRDHQLTAATPQQARVENEQRYWTSEVAEHEGIMEGLGQMYEWDDFGGGFGIGINQFLSTQIQF